MGGQNIGKILKNTNNQDYLDLKLQYTVQRLINGDELWSTNNNCVMILHWCLNKVNCDFIAPKNLKHKVSTYYPVAIDLDILNIFSLNPARKGRRDLSLLSLQEIQFGLSMFWIQLVPHVHRLFSSSICRYGLLKNNL